MRTDAVIVDSFLGQGDALDTYSHGLQEQAIRRERLTNDRRETENDILREALQAIRTNQADRVKLLEPVLLTLGSRAPAETTRGDAGPAPARPSPIVR